MAVTFAQYLIDKCLPKGEHINRPVDKGYLEEILTHVAKDYPAQYDRTVSGLKRLGDTFSTYDAFTMGLDEISVPNKRVRDKLVKDYSKKLDAVRGDENRENKVLGEFQQALAKNDLDGTTDDASLMIRSAMGGKKGQMMKLRTSPGVVVDHNGKIVPDIFPTSYAEGVDPVHFWLGAAESRKNISEGQVNTAKPGEMSKVISNVMMTAVVSREDCGSTRGLLFPPRDDSIIDRYLARDVPECNLHRNDLITPDVQQKLLQKKVDKVLVRSPQTCESNEGSVCQKCMGLRPSTGKNYEIGDNAGLISSGNMAEPLTQMTLSSKHSTTMATVADPSKLEKEEGFRQIVEMPVQYKNRKILCEVVGTVYRIRRAAQGGTNIWIRQTKPVPDRYIVHAHPVEGMKNYWEYHVPPNLKLVEGLKEGAEVYPGMELSNGIDNLQDISRLRNLGFTRSAAAENMYRVYKNTGQSLDRRHFELLARQAHPYVQIIKAPATAPWVPGECITYEKLCNDVKRLPRHNVPVSDALGKVLGEGVLDLTVGTEVDAQVQKYLRENRVNMVSVVSNLEVAPSTTQLSRVVNRREDWLSAMNHRHLKTQLVDAASFGKASNVHGYNPITAYAFGAEMGHHAEGRY